jgi:hypothetical protein
MKLKLFLAKMLAFIAGMWKKLDSLVDKLAPVAIKIVDEIKKVNESTTGDIIDLILSKAIPGTADDVAIDIIRAKLKEILPKILLGLNMSESIANIQDPNEQLKAIIAAINMSPDEVKNAHYHTLCAMILQAAADGKLSWSESVQIAEFYYTNIYKK